MESDSIRLELPLGEVNGFGLRIAEITDSTIAARAARSILSLTHLQVAPAHGNVLYHHELEEFGLVRDRYKPIFDRVCEGFRNDCLRRHFLPGLKLVDLGRIMNGDYTTPDGVVYIRIAFGHRDLMARLSPGDLWTGSPFSTTVIR